MNGHICKTRGRRVGDAEVMLMPWCGLKRAIYVSEAARKSSERELLCHVPVHWTRLG
jgi:hypothetical protein